MNAARTIPGTKNIIHAMQERTTHTSGTPDTVHRILLIEDEKSDAVLIELELKNKNMRFVSRRVETREEFTAALDAFRPDVVLADYYLPLFSAIEALQIMKERHLEIPLILVTGSQSEEIAVECIKQGAEDYILKQSLTRLSSAILNALSKKEIEKEKENAIQKLRNSREQLRALSAHIQSVREEERTRIAREIHDELGQGLTALKMDLSWIKSQLPDNAGNSEEINETLRGMSSLIDSTIQTVRRIATELRPSILDDLGLVSAIEWQTGEFRHRTGIECRFVSTTREIVLESNRLTAVFRILQEALTNVARHARATRISIRFESSTDDITLEIADNGKGFDPDQIVSTKSLGLLGMKERAILLGGIVTIKSSPQHGTTVVVRIPRSSSVILNGNNHD